MINWVRFHWFNLNQLCLNLLKRWSKIEYNDDDKIYSICTIHRRKHKNRWPHPIRWIESMFTNVCKVNIYFKNSFRMSKLRTLGISSNMIHNLVCSSNNHLKNGLPKWDNSWKKHNFNSFNTSTRQISRRFNVIKLVYLF